MYFSPSPSAEDTKPFASLVSKYRATISAFGEDMCGLIRSEIPPGCKTSTEAKGPFEPEEIHSAIGSWVASSAVCPEILSKTQLVLKKKNIDSLQKWSNYYTLPFFYTGSRPNTAFEKEKTCFRAQLFDFSASFHKRSQWKGCFQEPIKIWSTT